MAIGSLVLSLALLSLAALMVTGLVRYREFWGRAATVLLVLSLSAFCLVVERLASSTTSGESLFWSRCLMSLGIPTVLSSHLFALSLGRADPAGAIRRRRVSLLTLSLAGVGFLPFVTHPDFVTAYVFDQGAFSIRLGDIGRAYLLFLLGGVGLAAFRVEGTFRAARGAAREHLQWAVVGLFGAAGYATYLLTEGALGGSLDRDALVASAVPLLFASVLVSITHLRGRMADSGVTVERQVLYRSVTGMLAAAYLVVVLVIGYLAGLLGIRFSHLTAITFILIAGTGLLAFLLSRRSRRWLLKWVDRSFYSSRTDYRSYWLRASHELVSGVGIADLQARATVLIEDLFGARPMTIHLARRAGDPFRMMITTGSNEPPDVEPSEPLVRKLAEAAEPILIPAVEERRGRSADPELLPIFVENEILLETTSAVVVAPLREPERLLGFVTLGPKAGGGRYTHEDMILLETVTLQLAGAVRSAWLTEDLGAAREMEVFSQWANVVVHDLKNYVSPLKLFLQNARRHMHNPAFREQAIDDIGSVVEKMDRQILKLTAIRRGEEMSPTVTDLHWILDGAVARSGAELRPGIRVDRNYGSLPALTADPTLLDRVVSNLVTNAIEAMPEGGVLTLETEDVKESPGGQRWAVIRVRDTGVGMSGTFLRHRLFQPFATTKNKGWGLGLYQCRSIIEAHGGRLTASSEEGSGTEFTIRLPLKHLARAEKPLTRTR